MKTLGTERLVLRPAVPGDAGFICRLMNEAAYLRYIGDRGVRTPADALRYLQTAQVYRYDASGLGLNVVEALETGRPVGVCGLVKRAELNDVDLGYAIASGFSGHGWATEAARATLRHAMQDLKLHRVVAVTSPDNHGSQRVLRKVGMRFEGVIRLQGRAQDSLLFAAGQ